MKKLLLLIGIASLTMNAQVPTYVPTNGLVAYYPFNGNANDASTNTHNGTVTGATLTTDRYGNANSAYDFSLTGKYIDFFSDGSWATNDHTISFWFNTMPNGIPQRLLTKRTSCLSGTTETHFLDINFSQTANILDCGWGGLPSTNGATFTSISYIPNAWNNLIYIRNGNNFYLYLNGILVGNQNGNCPSISCNLMMRAGGWSCPFSGRDFTGKFDDLGIWNRALTQDEITSLYQSEVSCQSLVINSGTLSSFNPPVYQSTVTIYPNPANDHITIDCGTLANVVGYHIEIVNTLGQVVFNQPMNTQQYNVALNTWSGTGVYFVKIYDASNTLLNTKKIILQ